MNFIRRDSVSIMEKITANTNAELYKSIMNLKNYNKSDFFMKKVKKFLTAFFLGCNFLITKARGKASSLQIGFKKNGGQR